ncbi:MAG: hypothetical protein BMS9Abin02_0908 [Anaerolineae bacterium]|nr:MAG: hypothetical protein BMS9Abin02_0908 [Anaerolineae bacterium]
MKQDSPNNESVESRLDLLNKLIPFLLAIVPFLYLVTLARGLVFGDPTEFTFVANILGIAHPPGYPVITLLGKLFQSLIPFGDIPWRMHLLSAVAASIAVFSVYGIIVTIGASIWNPNRQLSIIIRLSAVFAALTVATAANFWQHAIHANPHIITAAFLSANIFFLTRWWSGQRLEEPDGRSRSMRWLYVFSFSAGVGLTHHPLTVFTFPAYAIFILLVRPSIWREWRTWLKMLAFAILGLGAWLYFPIRSPMEPAFGPNNMNTLDGFLNHVLARGIRESIPFFGLTDQFDRGLVFWTLLRLQYSLTTIFLAFLGLVWLILDPGKKKRTAAKPQRFSGPTLRPLGVMFVLAFLLNYLFVINLRQQDIMAYLLGVFLLLGLFAGFGLLAIMDLLKSRSLIELRVVAPLFTVLFLLGPVLQVIRNAPYISLSQYNAAETYRDAVFSWFEGQNDGAVLLNDWEHMTPLWYTQFVEDRWPDPAEVTPRLVSTDRPWLESVYDYLPGGPVYLSGYKPEIAAAGFRLRPRGPFYQVVEPGEASLPPELTKIAPFTYVDIEVLAFQLPESEIVPGDIVPLTLAMRAPEGSSDFYTPVIYLGDGDEQVELEFTTDSHLVTPSWQPGEVIVERFDFALPPKFQSGVIPITLALRNLSSDGETGPRFSMGDLKVSTRDQPIDVGNLLANFRYRVGLSSADARVGLGNSRSAPWVEPLRVSAGETIHLTFEWKSLAQAEESYTIFVHLIDLSNRPLVALDYTPLGGSTPTYLWIPKWLPGQRLLDPYQLQIPADLPPGEYLIEVGIYEMTSGRRLHISDPKGNLIGDRYILGPVIVEE